MEEITSDLKHLIKLQRLRPAFARTISWEFSQSEGGQQKGKSNRKTKGASQVYLSTDICDVSSEFVSSSIPR